MSGRARFAFWWEDAGDNGENLPFFNVIENDKGMKNGSTVDAASLLSSKYEIPLPLFPSYETWRREIAEKRRCRYCWAVVRSVADNERHIEIQHPFAFLDKTKGGSK